MVFNVNFTSIYLLGDSIFINRNVRSYTTNLNINEEVVDHDYGDIVVADFNFDDREDFALKREEGGNSGPHYNYYLQSDESSFVRDKYLSDTMIWFPEEIDKQEFKLKTLVRANAVSVCQTTYQYNSTKKRWKEVDKQFFGN